MYTAQYLQAILFFVIIIKGIGQGHMIHLDLEMCINADCLEKVIIKAFHAEIMESMSALQPCLSVCSSRPCDDFVARQMSCSLSFILYLFTFCGVIFHISIIHPAMCGKRQKEC